jgi:hypothetical protein
VLWIAIVIGVAGILFEVWRFRRFVRCIAEQFPPDSKPLPFAPDWSDD